MGQKRQTGMNDYERKNECTGDKRKDADEACKMEDGDGEGEGGRGKREYGFIEDRSELNLATFYGRRRRQEMTIISDGG